MAAVPKSASQVEHMFPKVSRDPDSVDSHFSLLILMGEVYPSGSVKSHSKRAVLILLLNVTSFGGQ